MNDLNEVNPDKIRLLTAFTILIHFIPMLHIYIYTPWKRHKTKRFLTFSRGI